jgi:ABC-type siderophore export system fused ATPase/permease subunit
MPNIFQKIFSGGAGDLVDKVAGAVDRFVQTKEEKAEAQIELQKVINSHLEVMEQEATKQMEIQQKEMDSARNREIQIAVADKAPLINKIVTPILALSVIALTFALFYILMFKQVGTEKDIIIYVLGVLSAVCTQVVSFYFGSSQGSENKQQQLEKLFKKQ